MQKKPYLKGLSNASRDSTGIWGRIDLSVSSTPVSLQTQVTRPTQPGLMAPHTSSGRTGGLAAASDLLSKGGTSLLWPLAG